MDLTPVTQMLSAAADSGKVIATQLAPHVCKACAAGMLGALAAWGILLFIGLLCLGTTCYFAIKNIGNDEVLAFSAFASGVVVLVGGIGTALNIGPAVAAWVDPVGYTVLKVLGRM